MNKDEKLTAFSKAILKLRTEDEIKLFLQNYFANNEIERIESRWEIVKYLESKLPYLEIQRLTGASSATISKISQSIKYNEKYQKLIQKILKR